MRSENIDQLMNDALRQDVFPGAVLLVSYKEHVLLHRAYGWADLFARHPMTIDTLFDLASLTKPLSTALAVMRLVRQKQLDLDRSCADMCPALAGTDKAGISIRHLLSHRSGLPAWRPYYAMLSRLPFDERTSALRSRLLGEHLQAAPGQHTEYSDVGYLLLQWIVEKAVDQRLDRYVEKRIYQPLGLKSLFYMPADRNRSGLRFAATELCPWRHRLLKGEVHDDNASVMGGVGAHAGLFGTARAVYDLLAGLLAAEQGRRTHPLFNQELLKIFFQRQGAGTWALGFDTPSTKASSSGRHFTAGSVGHLGFTGTSFWMDRQQSVIVVLLTNRVHPSRYNSRIRVFRPLIHDRIMAVINDR